MIKQDTIVTLEDNREYIVTSVLETDNEKFVVLFEVNNFDNKKICIEEIINGQIALTELPDCEENKAIFLKIFSKLEEELEQE